MLKTTDDEYVEKIIKTEKSRKKTIIFLVVFAFIVIIPIGYYTSSLFNEITTISDNLASTNSHTQEQASKDYDKKESYYLGIIIGISLTSIFFACTSMLGQALIMHFTGRKDRLLIKHYSSSNE